MNLELLENFGQNYPTDFEGTLECNGTAVTCAFNRRGTLFAVGCNDGRLFIFDFLTRGIAKIITAHVKQICTISWNRPGTKFVTSCVDNTVSLWDVLHGTCEKTWRFPGPVTHVQFHPRRNDQLLVSLIKHPPVLMKIDTGKFTILPLGIDNDPNVVARYNRRGTFIYTGNSHGRIQLFKAHDCSFVASVKLPPSANVIRAIVFSRRGNFVMINAHDRVIRIYREADILQAPRDSVLEPFQKLQDHINKTIWKTCAFSGDGEYVCLGSAKGHILTMWDMKSGSFISMLNGTKGELMQDMAWHPVRPVICSISSGVVSIWAQNQVENWSAFAPDFKELDENVEYEERESEFDLEDEDKSDVENDQNNVGVESDVDVTTVEPIQAFVSSDEEVDGTVDEPLDFIPVTPDMDDPDDSWGLAGESPARSGNDASVKRKSNSPVDSFSKKKSKIVDVQLPNAPVDVTHPLLGNSKRLNTGSGRKSSFSAPFPPGPSKNSKSGGTRKSSSSSVAVNK